MEHRDGAANPITIVLADDHSVMRSGLRRLLDDEAGFKVVAEAATTTAALQMARGHRPDVLVLDLNMPGGSSIAAIRSVMTFAPATRIVMLTMEHDPTFVRAAYEAGACDYVVKDAAPGQLVDAIRRAVKR